MSGISTSVTWAVNLSDALLALRSDFSTLDTWPVDQALLVTSRNNALEYNFRDLLEAFSPVGLEYFGSTKELRCSNPFSAVLTEGELDQAILGLSDLLSNIRLASDKCIATWNNESRYDFPEHIQSFLTSPWPSSFKETESWISNFHRDGDSFFEAVGFLHGHLLCLQEARSRGIAILYAVWLY